MENTTTEDLVKMLLSDKNLFTREELIATLNLKNREKVKRYKLFDVPTIPMGAVFVNKKFPRNFYSVVEHKGYIKILNLSYFTYFKVNTSVGDRSFDKDKKMISERGFRKMFGILDKGIETDLGYTFLSEPSKYQQDEL